MPSPTAVTRNASAEARLDQGADDGLVIDDEDALHPWPSAATIASAAPPAPLPMQSFTVAPIARSIRSTPRRVEVVIELAAQLDETREPAQVQGPESAA